METIPNGKKINRKLQTLVQVIKKLMQILHVINISGVILNKINDKTLPKKTYQKHSAH